MVIVAANIAKVLIPSNKFAEFSCVSAFSRLQKFINRLAVAGQRSCNVNDNADVNYAKNLI